MFAEMRKRIRCICGTVQVRLWSYGDSHAAGHELGAVTDLGHSWIKENSGFEDRTMARDLLGTYKYQELVRERWYDYLFEIMPDANPDACTPELSFAGQYAKLRDVEFINRAMPGSSNDSIVRRMLQDMDKWDVNDIVMVCHVDESRYMPQHNLDASNYKTHNLPTKVQRVMLDNGPSDMSYLLWNQGLVALMKCIRPNAIVVYSTGNSLAVEDVDLTERLRSVPLSFTDFVKTKWDAEEMRYPGGHFDEICHQEYAKYIKEII